MTVAAADSEGATSLLWDLHPTGIAELGSGPDRPAASPDHEPTVELVVGFDTEADARAAAATVAGWPLTRRVPAVEPVDDTAWYDPDRRAIVAVAGHRLDLEVGPAFGDGGHPSTRLALGLLAEVVTAGGSVLDVGTGTGVLALGARALGAASVTAVDNDPAALAVAGRNLASHPEVAQGRIHLAAGLPEVGRFDVVVVNVVLGTQRLLASAVAALLAGGGTLVVAGLLTTQEPELRALHPGLTVRHRRTEGDWLGLALGAPAPA